VLRGGNDLVNKIGWHLWVAIFLFSLLSANVAFGLDGEAMDDLASEVETLRKAGAHFRNDIVTGMGGKQILLDDPAGNPIELFEPPRR
jgi:hypothetical protein